MTRPLPAWATIPRAQEVFGLTLRQMNVICFGRPPLARVAEFEGRDWVNMGDLELVAELDRLRQGD